MDDNRAGGGDAPSFPGFGKGGYSENEPALGSGVVQTRPPFRRGRERMGHPRLVS